MRIHFPWNKHSTTWTRAKYAETLPMKVVLDFELFALGRISTRLRLCIDAQTWLVQLLPLCLRAPRVAVMLISHRRPRCLQVRTQALGSLKLVNLLRRGLFFRQPWRKTMKKKRRSSNQQGKNQNLPHLRLQVALQNLKALHLQVNLRFPKRRVINQRRCPRDTVGIPALGPDHRVVLPRVVIRHDFEYYLVT
jgi:hypothetical protein